jgi:hypothetical protein
LRSKEVVEGLVLVNYTSTTFIPFNVSYSSNNTNNGPFSSLNLNNVSCSLIVGKYTGIIFEL